MSSDISKISLGSVQQVSETKRDLELGKQCIWVWR